MFSFFHYFAVSTYVVCLFFERENLDWIKCPKFAYVGFFAQFHLLDFNIFLSNEEKWRSMVVFQTLRFQFKHFGKEITTALL